MFNQAIKCITKPNLSALKLIHSFLNAMNLDPPNPKRKEDWRNIKRFLDNPGTIIERLGIFLSNPNYLNLSFLHINLENIKCAKNSFSEVQNEELFGETSFILSSSLKNIYTFMSFAVQCLSSKKLETPRSNTLEKVAIKSRNKSYSRDKSITSQKSNLTKERSLRSNTNNTPNLKDVRKSLNYDIPKREKTPINRLNKNSNDSRSDRLHTDNNKRFQQIKSLERDSKLDRIMKLKTTKPKAESVVKMYMSVKKPNPISFKKDMNISGELSKINKETYNSFGSESSKSFKFESGRVNTFIEKVNFG